VLAITQESLQIDNKIDNHWINIKNMMINDHENSSMDVPIHNMLLSSSSTWTFGPLHGIINFWIIKFN
jgi:hypothetical protein